CGDRVFLTTADEAARKQLVLAFDRKTGKPLWSTVAHAGGFPRLNPKNSHASATPACDGERVYSVFINGDGLHVTATDLDGKLLWSCAGPAEVTACTPACSDRLVFATGGFPEKELLAVRADGAGDVGKSHVVWRTNKGVAYVPSPLYHRGSLFVVADGGAAT